MLSPIVHSIRVFLLVAMLCQLSLLHLSGNVLSCLDDKSVPVLFKTFVTTCPLIADSCVASASYTHHFCVEYSQSASSFIYPSFYITYSNHDTLHEHDFITFPDWAPSIYPDWVSMYHYSPTDCNNVCAIDYSQCANGSHKNLQVTSLFYPDGLLIFMQANFVVSHVPLKLQCRIIAFKMTRTLYRRHDYVVLKNRLLHNTLIHSHSLYHSLQIVFDLLKYFIDLKSWNIFCLTPLCSDQNIDDNKDLPLETKLSLRGGGLILFSRDELQGFISTQHALKDVVNFQFVSQEFRSDVSSTHNDCIYCIVPLHILAEKLHLTTLKELFKLHNIHMSARPTRDDFVSNSIHHKCASCKDLVSVFKSHNKLSKYHIEKISIINIT
jgi:hypothetical protein